jgi:hypothetical protein
MKVVVFAVLAAIPGTASADAVVTLRAGTWKDNGWAPGTPTVTIADVHLVGKRKQNASVPVHAGRELVHARVAIDGKDDGVSFLIDVRDGHHYVISPDPCCILTVSDSDDGLASSARCAVHDICPAGTVEVDKFVYRKDGCGERPTCAMPAMLRVPGPAVSLEWEGDATPWSTTYQPAPVRRENPQRVIARRDGKVVFDDLVVLHHGLRYTLVLDGNSPPHIDIDEPAH